VPAAPEDICATDVGPVESNLAGRVTLEIDPDDLSRATGRIEVPPAVLAELVGLPAIEIIDSYPSGLQMFEVTEMAADAGGFTFAINFAVEPYWPDWAQETYVVVRAAMVLQCSAIDTDPDTREVHAITYIYYCDGYEHPVWVSSGELCTICNAICEEVAFPLTPEQKPDDQPLAGALVVDLLAGAPAGPRVSTKSPEGPRIVAVTKMSRCTGLVWLVLWRKSWPRYGMSPSHGTLVTVFWSRFWSMPPRTAVSPLFTTTEVVTDVSVVFGSLTPARALLLLAFWLFCACWVVVPKVSQPLKVVTVGLSDRSTALASLPTLGVTVRVMPTGSSVGVPLGTGGG